jgi:hypothetical protein
MGTLLAEDIPDLVAGTLKDLGRMRFQQIAQSLTQYDVMSNWLKKDKVTFDSGTGIQRTLMTKLSGAATHGGLYQKRAYNVSDLLTSMNIGWAHAHTYWAFEFREALMNRGAALVVKILKPRRVAATIDMAVLLEEAAWSLKDPSDKKGSYGIPYWVVKSATAGFNGQNPTGYSSVAGIDTSVAAGANFRNYTDAYTNRTKGDLIRKMRKAWRLTGFKSPVSVPDFRSGTGRQFRLYCGEAMISELEELGEARNDNLGRDLATMDDVMSFKRCSINYTPQLDSDTDYPIYGIDHNTFHPVVLKGDFLREHKPRELSDQPNTFVVDVDLTYNFICVDRRRNWVIKKAA